MIRILLPALLLAMPALASGDIPTGGTVAGVSADEQGRAAWRAVFAAIRSRDWATARAGIEARPTDPLASVARAELYTAVGAPQPGAAAVAALIVAAPDLPQAPALARLARSLGAGTLPTLPVQRELTRLTIATKRAVIQPTPAAAALARSLSPLLKANDGAAAEPLVDAAAASLSPEALAELRQRVAWAYYLGGDDAGARRVAAQVRAGGVVNDWAVQAAWVEGLSAFRAGDMPAAATAFAIVASQGRDSETLAAGLFWAARADMAAGDTARATTRLTSAAWMAETFYGLLAAGSLGQMPALPPAADPMIVLAARQNARAAMALVAIGETTLADRLLRQQARIGAPGEHGALVALARELGLTETQVWLCQHGPIRVTPSLAARYPDPAWSPAKGWRVDRALVLAHALQESQLRTDAVSPAGARGLMQLMPDTVRMVARHRGDDASAAGHLDDPALNFEYGQSYLEELAGLSGTGGLLPKVIAAYNAGPGNLAAWNARAGAADPLLFIESIPFAETRAYVAIVLRNYWMYQRATGLQPVSMVELAQGKWPRFPLARPAMATTVAANN